MRSIEELAQVSREQKERGKVVVLCHGVFDLLHIGHIRHFKAAKAQGDVLIVTVTPDRFVNKGPHRPVFGEMLRAESIAALGCVDYVAINEWPTAVEAIKKLCPDIYVKGSEYATPEEDITGEIINEEEAIKSVGGRIYFTNEVAFSSTELINRYLSPYPEEARAFLESFREKYKAEEIIRLLRELKKLKVLVVGDTIIDEYCYCQALGKPPKDNIIAAKYLSDQTFAGGALATANHIAGFCNRTDLLTCFGNDYRKFIRGHLKPNIRVFGRRSSHTIVKRRFIDSTLLSKLFEIAYVDDKLPSFYKHWLKRIPGYDLVLVADFGHGLIDDKTAELLGEKARFLAVNTQTNSANMGFNLITKYPITNYICLDEPELRLACHDKLGDLRLLIKRVSEGLKCYKMAITRGHLGSVTYSRTEGEFFHTPVFSTNVVDRTGAGDAYLAITAPCVASDFPMDVVGFIGNTVGALKVQIVGNKESVEPAPLFKFITALLK